jgi:hypothetical protein
MSEFTRQLAPLIVPIKSKEERAAIQAAIAAVRNELSDRHRVFGAELRIEKPQDPEESPKRMIAVIIVDYANRRNLEVLVGGSGEVVRVVDLYGAQPAFLDEELERARRIAEQDERVARFAKLKGAFVSAFSAERAADNARRIGVRYAVAEKDGSVRILAHAIVDLSTDTLVQFYETNVGPEEGR